MSITPTITAYGGPAVQADVLRLIGVGFGFTTSVVMVDTAANAYECDFIVDNGQSIHLTVPPGLPNGLYVVALGNRYNQPSVNTAGPILVPTPDVPLENVPTPPAEPVPDPTSPACQAIIARARLELGDYAESFEVSVQGDGLHRRYDLPVEVIDDSGTLTVETATSDAGPFTKLVETVDGAPGDYVIDYQQGVITLTLPLPVGTSLIAMGTNFQFFSDTELATLVRSAALKHTHNAESLTVYRDADQFKHFIYSDETVDSLPPVEIHPVALLTAYEALSIIQSDASFDIDVSTAEGTSLPRSQRFGNIGQLMSVKKAQYDELCLALGVGLNRIEVFTRRRVSRTTGRLVPVFVDREYDDVLGPPLRTYPQRNLGKTGSAIDQVDPYAWGAGGYGF